MSKPDIHVSIVITAYNSERNIANVLSDLLRQKLSHCFVDNIYVLSDSSTDNTQTVVANFNHPKIVYIENRLRLGKERSLNRFFSNHKGLNIIQLDDDIRVTDEYLISKLASGLISGGDLVCGYHLPMPPVNLLSRLAYFGANVWRTAVSLAGNSDRYFCSGQVRAFSKSFLQSFRFPEDRWISEDVYSFYYAKTQGFKVIIDPKANVYFQLPLSLSDYAKQMRRYLKSDACMRSIFGRETVSKYSTVKTHHKLLALIVNGIKQPVICVGFLLLQLIPKIQALYQHQPRLWDVSASTKIPLRPQL